MSNEYALFIIILPNDFNVTNSNTPVNVVKQESITLFIDTVSALVAPAAIPLGTCSDLSAIIAKENERALLLAKQRSTPVSVCVLLQNYLVEISDVEAVWMISDDRKTFQITFHVEFGFVCDRMLQDLVKLGIGERNGTKIFVLPTTVVLKGHSDDKTGSLSSLNSNEEINNVNPNKSSPIDGEADISVAHVSSSHDLTLSSKIRKRISESDFKKSVRARLMVHQVVASIRASSALSFDFVLLICLASMLAGFGLLENSTVIIVASMLVSPLMNPILGVVFGLSVRDHSLWRRGLRNEIIGLIICISCGFILGLFTTVFETKWGSSSSFPTAEMKSRGDGKRLWVGLFIALPSGAGVALSVLGGNTGSLVGVAISASLLPPAVNSGLLFAYALLSKTYSNVAVQSPVLNTLYEQFSSSLNCPAYVDNAYLPLYTCNLGNEAAILACYSLLLTIVNIICIVIMALIILRIKEVVPLHQTNKDITNFFHYDVKVARDYNKTIHEDDFDTINLSTSLQPNNIAQTIVNRWKTLKSSTSQQLQSPSINTDLESTNSKTNQLTVDPESKRKLCRLITFAKEYNLDIFDKGDCNLTKRDSREKVGLLVSDLIDMCQEVPSVFVDLYRLQPSGRQTSTDKEHLSFYQEIIEVLPAKWHQLFIFERQRRQIVSWPLTFDRSNSTRSYQLEEAYQNSIIKSNGNNFHQSLKKQSKKNRGRFRRQVSVPESNLQSIGINQENEVPVEGTRFRVAKPTTAELIKNESKLI